MSKTLIDVDDEALAEVAEMLGTATKKDTVNAALHKILADRRRAVALKRMIERSQQGVYEEMLNPERKIEAWRLRDT